MTAPDGIGLPDEAKQVLAEKPGHVPVHLRLPRGTGAKAACDDGTTATFARIWGQWWTGKASEVTCPACLELVHA